MCPAGMNLTNRRLRDGPEVPRHCGERISSQVRLTGSALLFSCRVLNSLEEMMTSSKSLSSFIVSFFPLILPLSMAALFWVQLEHLLKVSHGAL